jgi:hypothetical protein
LKEKYHFYKSKFFGKVYMQSIQIYNNTHNQKLLKYYRSKLAIYLNGNLSFCASILASFYFIGVIKTILSHKIDVDVTFLIFYVWCGISSWYRDYTKIITINLNFAGSSGSVTRQKQCIKGRDNEKCHIFLARYRLVWTPNIPKYLQERYHCSIN